MKKSCNPKKVNPNEVNPTEFILYDLDNYLNHILHNVQYDPVNLSSMYDGYKPSGGWNFDGKFYPTPTSSQIPNACVPYGTYKPYCKYEPYQSGTWVVDTSALIAEGTDIYEEIESMALETPIIADRHEYNNNSSLEQSYVTPAYSETTTTTTTNTTTHGCKVNPKISYSRKSKYKVGIKDTENGFNLELGAEYNFSNTNSNTATTTRTVTFPSFTTKVPPYTTTIVTVILNKGTYANYNVPVQTNLFGRFLTHHGQGMDPNDSRTYNYFDLYPCVELNQTCCAASSCSECVTDMVQALPDNLTVRFNGTGSFIADVASNNFVITTEEVDNATGVTISKKTEYVPAIYGPPTTTVTTS
ncbi:ETX/MTX2 family pore-forming toxin [Bacillus toyonensis]|uniref:ETX/MTX2 family pore-forming toxin n=1 Tax=Bacillus toyonensis TaxID=155322 RepID=UPI0001849E74